MASISIIITTLVGWSTAEPIYKKLRSTSNNIHVFVPKTLINRIKRENSDRNRVTIHNVDTLIKKRHLFRLVHSFVSAILTPLEYSENYKIILNKKLNKFGPLLKLFLIAKKMSPEPQCNNVNHILSAIFSPFTQKTFPTKNILVVTQFNSPLAVFLTDKNLNCITLLESWDHAAKAPMGYTSNTVYLWNDKLRRDWAHYQGDRNIRLCFPYKLGYAVQNKEMTETAANKKYWLYAATFSEHSAEFFEEELRFLNVICDIAYRKNRPLYIKPKPNSSSSQFRFLTKRYRNVSIGEGQNSKLPNEYILDENYNNKRTLELRNAIIVINIGTTYAFDAAAFGIPVFQYIINAKRTYPNIHKIQNYPHLKKHIYSKRNLTYKILEESEGGLTALHDLENEDYKVATQFTKYLKSWLNSEITQEESDQNIINSLINCKTTRIARECY